jgi:hypothetical protein
MPPRFYEAQAAIETDKKAGKMPDRPLVEADFTRRRALDLPENRTLRCDPEDAEGWESRRGADCGDKLNNAGRTFATQ